MSNVERRRVARAEPAPIGSAPRAGPPRPRPAGGGGGGIDPCRHVYGVRARRAAPGGCDCEQWPLGAHHRLLRRGRRECHAERVGAGRLGRDLPGDGLGHGVGPPDQRVGTGRPTRELHARPLDRDRVGGLDHNGRQCPHLVCPVPCRWGVGDADLHRDDGRAGRARVGWHVGRGDQCPGRHRDLRLFIRRGGPRLRSDDRRHGRRQLRCRGGHGHLHDHAHQQRSVRDTRRHCHGHFQRCLRCALQLRSPSTGRRGPTSGVASSSGPASTSRVETAPPSPSRAQCRRPSRPAAPS